MIPWSINLLEPWRAFVGMSLINDGMNGVGVELTTVISQDSYPTALFQFDDGPIAEWNDGQVTEIMVETLMWCIKKKVSFSKIKDREIIWVRDSRCSSDGPAPWFLAFQILKVHDRLTQILCMGMKREYPNRWGDDSQLFTPVVLLVPEGQEPITEEYPYIMTPPEEWKSLEYMIARFYQEHKKKRFPALGEALDQSEVYFRDPLEPHRYAEIKRVFGIQ